jgi:hypothetical protein
VQLTTLSFPLSPSIPGWDHKTTSSNGFHYSPTLAHPNAFLQTLYFLWTRHSHTHWQLNVFICTFPDNPNSMCTKIMSFSHPHLSLSHYRGLYLHSCSNSLLIPPFSSTPCRNPIISIFETYPHLSSCSG